MAREHTPRVAHGERHEVLRPIRQIQALTLEVQELRNHPEAGVELEATEQTREQLRRRLAVLARRDTANDLSAAA